MSKQPEALRLADALRDGVPYDESRIEAELRRLHALNAELLEALQVLADEANGFNVSGVYFNEKCMGHKGLDIARAAIAKATREQA